MKLNELRGKMKRTVSMTVAAALMASMLITGCGSNAQKTETKVETQPETETVQESQAETTAAGETHVVTDMAGREVELPTEINSIATFGSIGVINAFVELMGSGDKICNDMTANFTKSDKWAMQYEFAPQIKGAPVLQNADGEIQMEDVLALNPDLCLVMQKNLIEPLESNGLNVIYFEWKQTDDVKTAVTLMGEVLGQQELAADYLTYFDDMTKEAEEKTASLSDDEKKNVLYGNVDKLTQPHVIAEWWMSEAGGNSVTKDSWTEDGSDCTYTQEDVLKWNPDVMIMTDASSIDAVKENSLYSEINAVVNDQMYVIPTVAHVWGNRTVEQPLTVFWTMNKLYPELETTEDLTEKIQYFYSHFFKYEMSDDQIKAIIGE